MKKNLLASILILLVSAFTLVGVTFAFFNSNNSGGDQNINITEFKFTRADRLINKVTFNFTPPTKLNFPKIVKPTAPNRLDFATLEEYEAAFKAYAIEYNLYLSDGDDIYFNNCLNAIEIKIANQSKFDIEFTAFVEATAQVGTGLTDFSNSIEWFMFDIESSEYLKNNGYDYASQLYIKAAAVNDGDTLPDGSTMPLNPTLRQKNEFRYKAARYNELKNLPQIKALKAGEAEDSKTVILIAWINYDKFIEKLPDGDYTKYAKGKLDINIAVTAQNIA